MRNLFSFRESFRSPRSNHRSLPHSARGAPFTRKVGLTIDAGLIVLFAAGNCGAFGGDPSCATSGPGKSIWGANGAPEVMTVAAANPKGQYIGYGGQGPAALDAMKRNEVETVKAFITKQFDTFRPSYGRYSKQHPRQCVLVGTTNSDAYLRDHTGNRRFWPVRCGSADLAALRQSRRQLWAEAVVAYRNDEQWWLEEDETVLAREEQAERFEHDVWQDAVNTWLGQTTKSKVTGLDIMEDCLGLERSQQGIVTGRRISQIMEQAGWPRTRRVKRKDKDGVIRKVYEWKNPQNDHS